MIKTFSELCGSHVQLAILTFLIMQFLQDVNCIFNIEYYEDKTICGESEYFFD